MNTLAICTDIEDKLADFDIASQILHVHDDIFPIIEKECLCLCNDIEAYISASKLTYLKTNYKDTKFFETYYSTEAWKVTEAISKMLVRLKNFFKRTIRYIRVFVIVRLGAAESIIRRWVHITDTRSEEVETYLKENEKKEIPADILTEMLSKSLQLYKEFLDQFTKVSVMTPESVTTANNSEKLIDDPPTYEEWLKDLEAVEDANPRNKKTMGKTAKTMLDGDWGDTVQMERLGKATAQARVVMSDLNNLSKSAEKMLADLEQSDNTPPEGKTDNDMGKAKSQATDMLQRKKLKFLKRFSSEVMTKIVGTFVKYVSFVGNQCELLCKALDKTGDKLSSAKA